MRAIRRRHTSIIGVLMHGLTIMDETVGKSITPPLLAGILRGADIANYNVLLYPHLLYTLHKETNVPFLDGHIDGLLWFAPRMGDSVLTRIAQAGLPTIALLTKEVPDRIGFVDTDGADGVMQAMRHLFGLGHRRIAYMGSHRQSNFIDRHQGYRRALTAEKLPWNGSFDIALPEGWQNEDVSKALNGLRALPDPPTAVVAATDSMAHSLIRAALESGMKIPQDLSVVGFDDIPDAEHIGGGLTTVRQPFRAVGLLAAESLASLIAGAPVDSCRTTIRTELVVRNTTRPPSRVVCDP